MNAPGVSTNKVFQKSSDIASKAKQTSVAPYSSGSQPVPVPGVQSCFPNVAETEYLRGQPLQSDSQAAVWRHAQVEHFKVALKTMRVDAPSAQGLLQTLPQVQALTAGCYFDASK